MGEFFDVKAPQEWRDKVYEIIRACPQHTFQILTKKPENIKKREFQQMPANVWLGVTITNSDDTWRANFNHFNGIKFVSYEPLLGNICSNFEDRHWVIIGAMSGPGSFQYRPKTEWVENILRQADENNVPVFMKNNLRPYYTGEFRQEYPIGRLLTTRSLT